MTSEQKEALMKIGVREDLHPKHVFVTDFGNVIVPPIIGYRVAAVPRRKDGWFDKRFNDGKRAIEWHSKVMRRASELYISGDEMQPDDIPAF
jgi:hypothetical protein